MVLHQRALDLLVALGTVGGGRGVGGTRETGVGGGRARSWRGCIWQRKEAKCSCPRCARKCGERNKWRAALHARAMGSIPVLDTSIATAIWVQDMHAR